MIIVHVIYWICIVGQLQKMLLASREVKNYLLHLNIMNPKLVSKMLLSVMTFIDVN